MNTSINQPEQHIMPDEAHITSRITATQVNDSNHSGSVQVHELAIWLNALRSFFKTPNYPLSNKDQVAIFTRDWTSEVRIACAALLHTTQLALSIVKTEGAHGELIDEADEGTTSSLFDVVDSLVGNSNISPNSSVLALSEVLINALTIWEELLETRAVNFRAWNAIGKTLKHELDGLDVTRMILRTSQQQDSRTVQSLLSVFTRSSADPDSPGADMLAIISELYLLLQRLRLIEDALRLDHPLKMLLPVFTLVHEEGRNLVRFIGTRALRTSGLDRTVFEALDGTNYAITMELRKVYAQELVGLSSLRQAPSIYARVENAHGLLRDCFQQSIVALVQLFDPTLDGSKLFYFFQTKLQQSLALRQDLWALLVHVHRAEQERDSYPLSRLLARLAFFREKSMHYLMYKDWEALERFIEEVSAARGAVELAPVLNRFGTYLETLHGQVNMRAILADHPFEPSTLETLSIERLSG